MISVLYFARFREKLGLEREALALPERGDVTVATVLALLAARGEEWQVLFGGEQTVLAAINQEMAALSSSVYEGDELAFFPPVTGG